MANNDKNKFYAEILKALWGYLSDQLSIPVSELNKEIISQELIKYGVAENVVTSIIAMLDRCEFAQYAPELSDSNMNEVYDEIGSLMDKQENTRRK